MRKHLRKLILDIISHKSNFSEGVHILNGHYISLDNELDNLNFENLIIGLMNDGFRFVDIYSACNNIKKNHLKKKKIVSLTFDDGYEECYTKILPILQRHNISATFFINTDLIDNPKKHYKNSQGKNLNKKYMNKEMILNLINLGHHIGAHTKTHFRLNSNNEMIKSEIIESRIAVEELTKQPCDLFAWPYGQVKDINSYGINLALKEFKYVFAGAFKNSYMINNEIFTRRHFEGDWEINHLKYFLKKKTYNSNYKF